MVTDQSAPARYSIASHATPNTPSPSAKKTPMRYELQARVALPLVKAHASAPPPTRTAATERP